MGWGGNKEIGSYSAPILAKHKKARTNFPRPWIKLSAKFADKTFALCYKAWTFSLKIVTIQQAAKQTMKQTKQQKNARTISQDLELNFPQRFRQLFLLLAYEDCLSFEPNESWKCLLWQRILHGSYICNARVQCSQDWVWLWPLPHLCSWWWMAGGHPHETLHIPLQWKPQVLLQIFIDFIVVDFICVL